VGTVARLYVIVVAGPSSPTIGSAVCKIGEAALVGSRALVVEIPAVLPCLCNTRWGGLEVIEYCCASIYLQDD
jgi:hypothetical protein